MGNPAERTPASAVAFGVGSFSQSTSQPALVFEFALPKDENAPSEFLQCANVAPIAFNVRLELSDPELDARLRKRGSRTTRMTMPEAAVNENGEPMPREN